MKLTRSVCMKSSQFRTLICAVIDTDRIKQVREKLPAYKDRRPELYTV